LDRRAELAMKRLPYLDHALYPTPRQRRRENVALALLAASCVALIFVVRHV
jgi:ferric-dicitrate binding protein FerR (iron transport regulator)